MIRERAMRVTKRIWKQLRHGLGDLGAERLRDWSPLHACAGKIENENNNVLKNCGNHLEQNFGHGKAHLSSLLIFPAKHPGDHTRKYSGERSQYLRAMKNVRKFPWLRLINLNQQFANDFIISIGTWGRSLEFFLERNRATPPSRELISNADLEAWTSSGLRCHALDACRYLPNGEIVPALECIARAAASLRERGEILRVTADLAAFGIDLPLMLYWIATASGESPTYGHFLDWRTWAGKGAYVDSTVLNPEIQAPEPCHDPKSLFMGGTRSQKQAMRKVGELIRVKRADFKFGGITPRTNSLLVGMSGSGKTWVCGTIAKMASLPFFTATVGSWLISGGRSDLPTCESLRRHLSTNGTSLIMIDEVDKLHADRSDNANYLAFVWDEIMALLDGRVDAWPNWSDQEISALKKSHFVAAGAFQDIYRAELGREKVLVEEEISSLEPLTFDKIVSVGWLPDELVNRLGSIIEIRQPEAAEIDERLRVIEADAEIRCDDAERENVANSIATSVTGMRGLENYALELAIRKLKKCGGV